MAIRAPYGGHGAGESEGPARFEDLWQDREFVRGFAHRMVRDAHVTEDVVQETYLQAFRSLDGLEERTSFIPWLATVARCRAINEVKKNGRARPVDDLPDTVDDSCVDPADRVEQRETLEIVRHALDRLTHRERRLLIRQVEEGLSMQQLADAEHSSIASVKSVLTRARSKLRRVLEDAGAWALAPVTLVGSWVRRHANGAALRVQQTTPAMQIGYERVGEMATAAAVALVLVGPGTVPPTGTPNREVPLTGAASVSIGRPTAAVKGVVAAEAETPPRASIPQPMAGAAMTASESYTSEGPSGDESDGTSRLPWSPGGSPAPGTPDAPRSPDPENPTNEQPAEQPEDAYFKDLAHAPGPQSASSGGKGTLFALGQNLGNCVSAPCVLLFRSTDGGASWEKLPARGLDAFQMLVPPDYPADLRIYAMGNPGLQVSTDHGATFTRVAQLAHTGRAVMSPGFSDGHAKIYVGSVPPWIYDAERKTGSPMTSAGFSGTSSELALPSTHPQTGIVFAGQQDSLGQALVYRCEAQAKVCAESTALPGSFGVPSLAVSRNYATDRLVLAWKHRSLYRSSDAGASFEAVEGLPEALAIKSHADDGRGSMYLATRPQGEAPGGVLASRDSGRTWSLRGQSSPIAVGIDALAVTGTGDLLAARAPDHGGGLFCSTDGGFTWRPRCGQNSNNPSG